MLDGRGASSNACSTAPTGATLVTYDNQGNRSSSVAPGNAGTSYEYDQVDQLTSIQTGIGSSCGSSTNVGNYYDGTGLRMSKTVGGTATQFTSDESGSVPTLLQVQVGIGNPTSYIYGPGGLPVEMINSAINAYFYAHDQLDPCAP